MVCNNWTNLEYEALEDSHYLCHSCIYTEHYVIQQNRINTRRMLLEVLSLQVRNQVEVSLNRTAQY